MTRFALVTAILVLAITACTPAALPTSGPLTPEPITPTLLSTITPTCETHTASVVLSSSAEDLRVGDTVTITVTLVNEGCVALGLPQYRLTDQSDGAQAIFDPADPEPINHSLGVAPGQSDTANFELKAVASGQANFSALVSFEVHIGYPGPAYWGSSSGELLSIMVAP
jgi:hypothetical protein